VTAAISTSEPTPYSIGFLEWDGSEWVCNLEPVFTATQPWERGTVAEPNLLYHDGRWLLWYCTGLSASRTHVIGYAESPASLAGPVGGSSPLTASSAPPSPTPVPLSTS
jgi:hypothetical protein